jgi:hypothetical protein
MEPMAAPEEQPQFLGLQSPMLAVAVEALMALELVKVALVAVAMEQQQQAMEVLARLTRVVEAVPVEEPELHQAAPVAPALLFSAMSAHAPSHWAPVLPDRRQQMETSRSQLLRQAPGM